jgi:HSP20 family protein
VKLDLPGVDPARIDLDVESNVITVRAERGPEVPEGVEAVATERLWGSFSRQLVLGEALDTENVQAEFDGGVLTLRVPITPQAKPRKIAITSSQTPTAAEKQQVEA